MKIGLASVFRNEERNLVSALHSCYRAVDLAILLDNGSTDRSSVLAHQYCVKAGLHYGVMSEPDAVGWPDHLYNRAIEECERHGCDWILLLDADERLSGACRASLRAMAQDPSVGAYALSRRTIIEPYCPTAGGEIEPYTDSLEINENHLRFFRSGAVRYPAGGGPHRGAQAQAGVAVSTRPFTPTDIFHQRDGLEQLRRDKLRGQYPETPLPELWQATGGWFDYSAIYDLAVSEARHGGVLVELGNYLGRSLLYLGKKAQESGKGLTIYGADLYRSQPCPFHHVEIMSTGTRWLPVTAAAVHRAGLADDVNLLQCPSWDAARLFDEGAVDFVFVDACHEYESVCKDLLAWWPKVRSGGLMGGHDWSELFPGVMSAVSEFAEREGLALDVSTSLGSWLVRKP